MELAWRRLREPWELPETRRYRSLALSPTFPVLLGVFLAYDDPKSYETYLLEPGLVRFGLHTTLKGQTFMGWEGREKLVEGPFVRVLRLVTIVIGVTVLVYAV